MRHTPSRRLFGSTGCFPGQSRDKPWDNQHKMTRTQKCAHYRLQGVCPCRRERHALFGQLPVIGGKALESTRTTTVENTSAMCHREGMIRALLYTEQFIRETEQTHDLRIEAKPATLAPASTLQISSFFDSNRPLVRVAVPTESRMPQEAKRRCAELHKLRSEQSYGGDENQASINTTGSARQT